MVYDTEPLLGKDWNKTDLHLRYEGFYKETNPKVSSTFYFVIKLQIKYNLCNGSDMLIGQCLNDFQEYKLVVEKLREAYFKNTADVDAIRNKNIALISDLHLIDSVLKSVILQTNANNNGKNKSQHKNTFLYK